jgi:hypothetical protein
VNGHPVHHPHAQKDLHKPKHAHIVLVVVEEPKRELVAVVVVGALIVLVARTVTRVENVGHVLAGVVLAKVRVHQVAQKPAQIHKDARRQ